MFYNFIYNTDSSGLRNSASNNLPGGDTMYTNLANLQQTMLLQQRMFLQALCQQNSLVKNVNQNTATATNMPATGAPAAATMATTGANNDAAKKHFIAPSLSQYRFVSGQQVNTFYCFMFVFFPFWGVYEIKWTEQHEIKSRECILKK